MQSQVVSKDTQYGMYIVTKYTHRKCMYVVYLMQLWKTSYSICASYEICASCIHPLSFSLYISLLTAMGLVYAILNMYPVQLQMVCLYRCKVWELCCVHSPSRSLDIYISPFYYRCKILCPVYSPSRFIILYVSLPPFMGYMRECVSHMITGDLCLFSRKIWNL